MSSLFPNFKTFLFQGKGVTGEVPFIKFDTDLKGLYLPATFTRPNSPEDPTESGATVINADGTIRKLAEDEAPWSYPEGGAANGCLRLLNLPEATNLETDAGNAYSGGELNPSFIISNQQITNTGPSKNIFPQSREVEISGGLGLVAATLNSTNSGDDYVGLFEVKPISGSPVIRVAGNFAQSATNVTFDQNGASSEGPNVVVLSYTETINGWYNLVLKVPNAVGGTATYYVGGDGSGKAEFGAVTWIQGSLTPETIIPTFGGSITRNGDQMTFLNLISKGVFSSQGFSVSFNVEDFKGGGGTAQMILFGNKIDIARATSTTIKIRELEGFSSLATVSGMSVITYNGQTIKVFSEGIKKGEYTLSTTQTIDGITKTGSSDNVFKYSKDFGIAPYVLPEATAAALTA